MPIAYRVGFLVAGLFVLVCGSADDYGLGMINGVALQKAVHSYRDVLRRAHVSDIEVIRGELGSQMSEAERAQVFGFLLLIERVKEEHRADNRFDPDNDQICVPKNIDANEIRKDVGEFILKANNLKRAHGHVVVEAAMAQLYPCH